MKNMVIQCKIRKKLKLLSKTTSQLTCFFIVLHVFAQKREIHVYDNLLHKTSFFAHIYVMWMN